MRQTYENRLKKEFTLLQHLQKHPFNENHIIDIEYKERAGSNEYKSILEQPTNPLYPNKFRVTYKMPMLVDRDRWERNWSATFLFEAPEDTLMNPNSDLGVEIEGGEFERGSVPFNNHVSTGWVCTGSAWSVANQGFGIWYFVISLGCLLNQERFMMADDGHSHLNGDAYNYWCNERGKQPNNNIDWPFKLEEEIEQKKPTFKFGAKKEATTVTPNTQKSKFTFGSVKTNENKKPLFTFGPKS